jgi:ABC-type transporter Mla maintaining outer membrane lipid asymmetry ATPase subunit MlaF
LTLGPQAHATATTIRISAHNAYIVRRKNITIREDQAEWIEENHLNLSSFVRGQLDELIEERS